MSNYEKKNEKVTEFNEKKVPIVERRSQFDIAVEKHKGILHDTNITLTKRETGEIKPKD